MSATAASASSWLRPPRPDPRSVTVVSPPAMMQAGRGSGWPLSASSRATAASIRPASRASACRKVVSSSVLKPAARAAASAASAAWRLLPTIRLCTRAKRGSPGLSVSAYLAGHTAPQAIDDRRGRIGHHAVALQHRVGIGERAGVGHGRAGADHIERVADHVGENQRDHAGRVRQPRQPAALDLIEVLAQRVDLVDIRPAAQQDARERLKLGQADPFGRQRQQRRAAAGDQRNHQVALGRLLQQLRDLPRARHAALVGDGMARFDEGRLGDEVT